MAGSKARDAGTAVASRTPTGMAGSEARDAGTAVSVADGGVGLVSVWRRRRDTL